MDKVTGWSGLLVIMGTINVWLLTGSWWSLAVIPGAILLEFLVEYLFGEEKAKTYYLLILLVLNLVILPGAIKSLFLQLSD